MSDFLKLFFLFFIGCSWGWILEVFYRRFNKSNIEKKWINPGFLVGPYLPIYGLGLCTLYLLAQLESYSVIKNEILNKLVLFLAMAICMTLIEYIAGIIFIKGLKVKLWDYSKEKFNYKGIICLKFSLYWALMGAVYYFFINPYILDALEWFTTNIEFSFILGTFFGIFVIDITYSFNLVARIRAFAKENDVLIKYEELKQNIRKSVEEAKGKYQFLLAFETKEPLKEHLRRYVESKKEEWENKLNKK